MQGHFKSCFFLLFTVLTSLSAQIDDENGWPSFEFMKIGRIRPPPVDSGRGIDRISFGSDDRAIPPPWLLPSQTHKKEEIVVPPAPQVRSFFDDESGPGLLPVAPWTQSPPRPTARNVDEDRPPRPTSRVQQHPSVTSVKELPSSSIHINNAGTQQQHSVKPAAPVVRPHYASDDEGTPSISHVNQYPDEEGDDIPAYYRPTPAPRASESDFFRNHPEHRSVDEEEYQPGPRMFDPDRPIFRSGQTQAPHYLRDHYNDRYSTEEEHYKERQRPQQRPRPSYDPYREDEYEQRQPPPPSNRRNPRPRPEESRQEEREISGHSFDQSERPLSKRPLPLNDELLPGQRDRPVLKQTNKLPPEEFEQNEQQRPQQQSSDSNNNDGPQLYLRPPGGGGRRPLTESKEPEVNKDSESQPSPSLGQQNKDEEQQQRPSGGGRRPPNNSRPPVDEFNNNNNEADQFNHGHGNHHDHGGTHHDHGGPHNFHHNDDFRQEEPQFNGPPPRRPPPRRPPPQRPPPQRESVVTQGLNILKSVVGIQTNPPPRRPPQFRPEQRRPGPGGPHRRPPPREPIELSIDIGRQDYHPPRMVEDDEPFFDEDTSSTQLTDSEDPIESFPSSEDIEGRSIKLRPSSLKATNKLPANLDEEPKMEHRGFPKTTSDYFNSAESDEPLALFPTTIPETSTLAYIPTTTASTTTTTVQTTSSTLFPPFSKRVRPTHFSKIQDDSGQSRIMSYKQRIEAMKEKAKQREQQLKPTTLLNEPDQSTEPSVTQTVSISSSSTTARPSTTRPRIPPRMPVRKPSPSYTTTTTESNPFADEEEEVENKPSSKFRFQKTTTFQPPSEKEEFTKPIPVNPFERRRAQQQQDAKFLKESSFSKVNKLRQSSRLTSTTSVQPDDLEEGSVTEETPKIELVSIIDGQQLLEERSDSNLEVDQNDDLASSPSFHHHQPEMLSDSIRPSALNFASHDPILPIEELLNIRVRDNGKGM